MKLWLLDADIIIDLLAYNLFDVLIKNHEVFVAESVANEVEYYKVRGNKIRVDFANDYIGTGKVTQLDVSASSLSTLYVQLPVTIFDGLDEGEQESLAALIEHQETTFCTCDKAAIIALPFIDCAERGISAEELLRQSGLSTKGLEQKHTEQYFQQWLKTGRERKIYGL